MTSQGSAYARFRRALGHDNPTLALAAAAELPRLGLADALALCLLLTDEPHWFDRAVVRWHARFCLETPDVGVGEAALCLAALRALGGPAAEAGAQALTVLCEAKGLGDAAEAVEAWLERRG